MAGIDESHEDERLAVLHDHDILDTMAEEAFDRLTRLAQSALQVPIALVSLVDQERQWFKSCQGLDVTETSREVSFCAHAIEQDRPFIVPDTSEDIRFSNNPLVQNEPYIRFYAGIPLKTSDGYNLGTLCVIDTKPRDFADAEINVLFDLAQIVTTEIELRRIVKADRLTGALTHGCFHNALQQEQERATQHGAISSLVMFEIGQLASIIDVCGRSAGDEVLASVAATCRATLRSIDILGHVEHNRFAIILPRIEMTDTLDIIERLRENIENPKFAFADSPFTVSVDFGATTFSGRERTTFDLLERASEALHQAKMSGKSNCVLIPATESLTDVA